MGRVGEYKFSFLMFNNKTLANGRPIGYIYLRQKNIITLFEATLNNKFTVAASTERNTSEGSKLRSFLIQVRFILKLVVRSSLLYLTLKDSVIKYLIFNLYV